MDSVDCANFGKYKPIENIIKRQCERKKGEERNSVNVGGKEELESFIGDGNDKRSEIESFIDDFNEKRREIDKELDLSESIEPDKLFHHFTKLNELIQELTRSYSNATIFLRLYDKKVCQKALQDLQLKLQHLESRLRPKKKFGFKARKNKVETADIKNGDKKVDSIIPDGKFHLDVDCGFCNKNDEVLVLKAEELEKKDVLLSNLKNCSVKLYGNPSTLHITNLEKCKVYSGPVTTSVFVEKIEDCTLHVACQQLRIHETINTDFFIHVTSKAIIEDTKGVRFGKYNLDYDGIEEHYKLSGLDKSVNNWDNVDDFNWLASDKPSPNWSKFFD